MSWPLSLDRFIFAWTGSRKDKLTAAEVVFGELSFCGSSGLKFAGDGDTSVCTGLLILAVFGFIGLLSDVVVEATPLWVRLLLPGGFLTTGGLFTAVGLLTAGGLFKPMGSSRLLALFPTMLLVGLKVFFAVGDFDLFFASTAAGDAWAIIISFSPSEIITGVLGRIFWRGLFVTIPRAYLPLPLFDFVVLALPKTGWIICKPVGPSDFPE